MEANSTPLETSKGDGKTAISELKDQKGVGIVDKETAEQRISKRRGRVDDPPQLAVETKKAVDTDIGAASVGVTLGAFESEIERMSKDADAILDSIRNEAAESPKRMRRLARGRREAINKAHDDDDDWDDDMSEELNRLVSVSEEIRQAEIDFMRGLVDLEGDGEENENEPPLHGVAAERENETPRQTPSPGIKRSTQENITDKKKKMHQPLQKQSQKPQKEAQEQVQDSHQTTAQQQPQKAPTQIKSRGDPALLVGVVLVYLVIMIHVLRVLRNGLLDAEGGLRSISFR